MKRIWELVLFIVALFLLLALMAVLSPPAAGQPVNENIVGTLRNQAGGNITFSTLRNGCESPYIFRMWSRTATGNAVYGCWQLVGAELHVRWDSGTVRYSVFSIENIELTDWFERRVEQNSGSSNAKPKNYY